MRGFYIHCGLQFSIQVDLSITQMFRFLWFYVPVMVTMVFSECYVFLWYKIEKESTTNKSTRLWCLRFYRLALQVVLDSINHHFACIFVKLRYSLIGLVFCMIFIVDFSHFSICINFVFGLKVGGRFNISKTCLTDHMYHVPVPSQE